MIVLFGADLRACPLQIGLMGADLGACPLQIGPFFPPSLSAMALLSVAFRLIFSALYMEDWKWCYVACGADLVLILSFLSVDAWERVTIPIANGGICYIAVPDLGLRRVNLGIVPGASQYAFMGYVMFCML